MKSEDPPSAVYPENDEKEGGDAGLNGCPVARLNPLGHEKEMR